MKKNIILIGTLFLLGCDPGPKQGTLDNHPFVVGYPTTQSSIDLYDEMDYQRAVQAYIWATPLLNSMGFRDAVNSLGLVEGDNKLLIHQYALGPKQVVMTANNVTPYGWSLLDLKTNGPTVVELPAKTLLGGFVDFWMRALGDVGAPGADRGEGGKYLVLPPNYQGEIPLGYHVIKSSSNLSWFFVRANSVKYKGDAAFDVYGEVRIYPLSQVENPPEKIEMIAAGDQTFDSDWDKNYQAWSLIHQGMQLDNVRAQDKIIYDHLKGLGIEKGKPFTPTERQRQILTKAATMGAKMVANLAFANRNKNAKQWQSRQWETIVTVTSPIFETDKTAEITDRAANWYQLVMNGVYPHEAKKRPPIYNVGSAYLSSYKDSNGNYLDGGKTYRLRVAANVPAANFWSTTVYSNQSRSMIQNQQGKAALGSIDKLNVNDDGSIDLIFSPTKPSDNNANWMQTNVGEGWFSMFRFFGPKREYFDNTWILHDFELID